METPSHILKYLTWAIACGIYSNMSHMQKPICFTSVTVLPLSFMNVSMTDESGKDQPKFPVFLLRTAWACLRSKEAAHFVKHLTRGPSLNHGQFQTGQREEKVLTSLQISGKLMSAESSEIATARKIEMINWNTESSSYKNVYSPGSFQMFREKDNFRHTVSKIGTFLFHVALYYGFASGNDVITE